MHSTLKDHLNRGSFSLEVFVLFDFLFHDIFGLLSRLSLFAFHPNAVLLQPQYAGHGDPGHQTGMEQAAGLCGPCFQTE